MTNESKKLGGRGKGIIRHSDSQVTHLDRGIEIIPSISQALDRLYPVDTIPNTGTDLITVCDEIKKLISDHKLEKVPFTMHTGELHIVFGFETGDAIIVNKGVEAWFESNTPKEMEFLVQLEPDTHDL